MKYSLHHSVKSKYTKLYERVAKAIASGRFQEYTRAQKRALYARLMRYERRLKQWGIAVASAAALFVMPMQAQGQVTFTQQTGASNPFSSIAMAFTTNSPTLVDIDADGDLDLVSGKSDGTIAFYRNTGTAVAPAFTLESGATDPFSAIDVTYASRPRFVDIDGDGDLDLFVTDFYGIIKYYQNQGTGIVPVFVEQTGASNPLNMVLTVIRPTQYGYTPIPYFVDIDADGDQDVFIADAEGEFYYYKNNGTPLVPSFSLQTGSANDPLDGVFVSTEMSISFADVDGDNDMDLWLGNRMGNFFYLENTGTPLAPVFTQRTGIDNPFDGIDIGYFASPFFGDIDGDGDLDMVSGEFNNPASFNYFENTTPAAATPQFTARTGASNPLDGFDVKGANPFSMGSSPAFVDIDGDGDMDMIAGSEQGEFFYFENTGTALAPQFTARTGASNPLDGFDVGQRSFPAFVDIDGDGDMDMFSGEQGGSGLNISLFKFYENTGTALAPQFTARTGASNPLDIFSTSTFSAPSFVDIDGDGDMDMFSGEAYGSFYYFENTGTALAPQFTERTGTSNPFDGLSVPGFSALAFIDMDGDGDMDMVSGLSFSPNGFFQYFENIGTSLSPSFVARTGASSPVNNLTGIGFESRPAFVDIDGDGDLDLFSGEYYGGTFKYFENSPAPLPVELLIFTGRATGASNTLQWATATEENNEGFQIERSRDGRTFETIGWVAGEGTTQERMDYAFQDREPLAGLAYYRLKQVDYNGTSEYSDVISIARATANGEISIYPNPVHSLLIIEEVPAGIATIYNALGQPVQQMTITSAPFQLDVTALPRGIYTLQLTSTTGEAIHTQAIVKQ